jgi:flagellar basal-body rod modification protein FlgD
MTISPVNSTAPAQAGANPAGSASATDALANQNVFLQLLVAQLKHQDPQNPADSTQFVTQLAQFSALGEQVKSRTDLDAILKVMQTPAATPPAPASGPAQGSATGSSTTNN